MFGNIFSINLIRKDCTDTFFLAFIYIPTNIADLYIEWHSMLSATVIVIDNGPYMFFNTKVTDFMVLSEPLNKSFFQ